MRCLAPEAPAEVRAPVGGAGAGAVRPWWRERDLFIAGVVVLWIPAVLLADAQAGWVGQDVLGVVTWMLLLACLRGESRLTRAQVGVVVVFATLIEYTFSAQLHVYTYRLRGPGWEGVPAFVPPGHGLVYLAALCLGRSRACTAARRWLIPATLMAAAGYAAWGLFGSSRPDVLGALWFACLAAFLLWGRSPLVYVGAFLVVTYLELLGTHLGVWAWARRSPTGLIAMGNPPADAAGGYGFFDAAALLAAPALLRLWGRLRRGVEVRTGVQARTGVEVRTGVQARTGVEVRTGVEARTGVEVRTGVQARTGVEARTGVPAHVGAQPRPDRWIGGSRAAPIGPPALG